MKIFFSVAESNDRIHMRNMLNIGVVIFIYFFFFDEIYSNPFVVKAFYLLCGDKLISDGYCDMNLYISGKISKDSMMQSLKGVGSPFVELYRPGYPKTDNDVAKLLNVFFESPDMQNYKDADDMKFVEAQALVNWIYRAYRNVDARLNATRELMQRLIMKYNINDQILISQGIVYLESQVELHFICSVEEFSKSLTGMTLLGRSLFFRGHAEANYILIPSLMRKQNWLINERKMYNELIISSAGYFEKLKTHLEYLVEMQHYGLPTRLLDITRNPLVALYFACESSPDSYGEIVVFSIEDRDIKYPQSDTVSILASLPAFEYEEQQRIYEYASDNSLTQEDFNNRVQRLLHEVKTEKPAFRDEIVKKDLLHSLVVLPIKNNNRILKQDGAFILCGLSKDYRHLDVNEMRYNALNGKRQVFIVGDKQKILETLNSFSINKAALFPEIDDVADYIKSKY